MFGLVAVMIMATAPARGTENVICLNSLGYLPEAPKKATVSQACSTFTVRRAADDAVVFSGTATGPRHQEDVNQDVWIVDFSEVTQPGEYILDIPGVGRCPVFPINASVYDAAFITSMRAFYLWRCGTAVQGRHHDITYAHAPCHLQDGYLDYVNNTDLRRDGTGGWHDAGDYGKYVVNAGVTVGTLFLAWDHFSDRIQARSLDIPDTAPGYPDFLKEIKWEIDWLLKMQYPDGSGRVAHKVARLNFAPFIIPEEDTERRYFSDWSSAATADSAAMLAMAARYFQPYNKTYSQTCLETARKNYAYLKEHPEDRPFDRGPSRTGVYQTHDWDDRLWAAMELWETTGDTQYLKDFEARAVQPPEDKRSKRSPGHVDEDWDWGNIRNLAMFTYVLSEKPGRNTELKTQITKDLLAIADAIVAKARDDVYGRPFGGRYYWGCNGTVARQVVTLQVAHRIVPKQVYIDTSLDAIGHLFGRNTYGRSYVTGLGHQPPLHPHDRRSADRSLPEPWPGYIVGGGETATDWQDKEEDYRTNEIAINWQGALVYALAGFLGPSSP